MIPKKVTPKQKQLAWILTSSVFMLSLIGFVWILKHNHNAAAPDTTHDEEAALPLVQVIEIEQKDLAKEFELFSPLLPWKEAVIKTQITGYAQEVFVTVGSQVQKDQPLFRMDSEAQKLKSELEQIELELKQLDYNIAMALAKKNFLSKQEVRTRELENRATKIKARLSEIDNRGLLRAPFDGIVAEIGFKMGDYIDQSSSNGTMKVVDLSKMKVAFWIPQSVAEKINLESDVRIHQNEQSTKGKILAIAPTVDQKTGSVFVEAEVLSPPNSWKPGQYTQVFIAIEKYPDTVTIPASALHTEQGQTFVWRIQDNELKSLKDLSENQTGSGAKEDKLLSNSSNSPASAPSTASTDSPKSTDLIDSPESTGTAESRSPASVHEDLGPTVQKVFIKTGPQISNEIIVIEGLEAFDQVVILGAKSGLSDGGRVEISDEL